MQYYVGGVPIFNCSFPVISMHCLVLYIHVHLCWLVEFILEFLQAAKKSLSANIMLQPSSRHVTCPHYTYMLCPCTRWLHIHTCMCVVFQELKNSHQNKFFQLQSIVIIKCYIIIMPKIQYVYMYLHMILDQHGNHSKCYR